MNVIFRTIMTICNNLMEDIKNFNPRNTSEKVVLDSHFFSVYKGVPVIRTCGNRSGSLGILMITRETNRRKNENIEDIVRHEYGHTIQLKQLGLLKYLIGIGLPSKYQWGNESSYYDRMWEITADIYGGVVSRKHRDETIDGGFRYLERTKRRSLRSLITKNRMEIDFFM